MAAGDLLRGIGLGGFATVARADGVRCLVLVVDARAGRPRRYRHAAIECVGRAGQNILQRHHLDRRADLPRHVDLLHRQVRASFGRVAGLAGGADPRCHPVLGLAPRDPCRYGWGCFCRWIHVTPCRRADVVRLPASRHRQRGRGAPDRARHAAPRPPGERRRNRGSNGNRRPARTAARAYASTAPATPTDNPSPLGVDHYLVDIVSPTQEERRACIRHGSERATDRVGPQGGGRRAGHPDPSWPRGRAPGRHQGNARSTVQAGVDRGGPDIGGEESDDRSDAARSQDTLYDDDGLPR